MTTTIRHFLVFLFLSAGCVHTHLAAAWATPYPHIQEDVGAPMENLQPNLPLLNHNDPISLSLEQQKHIPSIRTKTVLFILPHYLGGGMGTAFVALINNFPNPSTHIDICVLRKSGRPYNGIERKNIRYISFSEAKRKKYTTVVSYAQWTSPSLWLDTIHAQKRVQWIHNEGSDDIWKKHLLQDKNAMKKIDAFVLVSEASKQNFARSFPQYAKKIHAIYNIIDNAYIKRASRARQTDIVSKNRLLNVISVGRFVYNKNFDTAIKVHAALERRGIHFRWYLLGYGEDEAKLQALIKEYHLQNKFIILGFRQNPYPYIKAADIFVHIPRIEGFGLVVTEAKILQRPILVSNYPAAYEQIQNGKTGLIVDNTFSAIYRGLKQLILNQTLRHQFSQALDGFTFDNKEVKNDLSKIFFEL